MADDDHMTIPSPYYRVSLKAIVFDSQQRLLVVQTSRDDTWELPGGGWEHGESMQHCLRREIIEELGVGVSDIDFKQIYPYQGVGRSGNMRLKLAIPVTLDSHDFTLQDEDVKAFKFVTPQEFASLEMIDAEVGIKAHTDRIWPK